MELQEWQEQVDDWIKSYGIRYFEVKTNSLLLTEEVGELCRLIARRYGEQSFRKDISEVEITNQIQDEIGDIFFVLTCISNQLDIDLEDILRRNLTKKTNRDHNRHRQNKKIR